MSKDYAYTLDQCDVPIERRAALELFRNKRRLWTSWISTDEHHAIWTVVSAMVSTDASFRALASFASDEETTALSNDLLNEALITGHVATQLLAIRRLMDNSKNVISLRRLLKDVRTDFGLFTRENYVCYDGLPYDYESVRRARLTANTVAGRHRGIWAPTSGPGADGVSEIAHLRFDKLAGVDPSKRSRLDGFRSICFQLSSLGSKGVARTSWRDGAAPTSLTRAIPKSEDETPISV
jgi:hypothetical protein